MNSHLTNLLDLPGVTVESWNSTENSVCFQLSILAKGINCPHCGNYTEELHQTRPIIVRDLPSSGKDVYLKLPRRQFYCRVCQSYVTERLQFIDLRRNYTQRYEESIFYQVNNSNIEYVSKHQHLDVEKVKNIFNHIAQKRKKQDFAQRNKEILWQGNRRKI
ncbi:transposase family protein [Iningainema tapete]|uniref:Transposase family protein n=1 Tax=Iningainema tapete BLCC-T55 TaxID=2748662 RepID=A0A8J6XU98_9CYAN|nr:transposase family protein [Iningainema tapete]MBD2778609.1 transposase family protein [Iningainema tapete BLCC-T55]